MRSPWAWAAAGIALLIWAPNLAWQATHGLPQLTMAHVIAGDAAANRAQLLPVLWLFTGPLLFLVTVAGWAWMLLAKAAAPWRTIAIAAVVVLVLVVASGGKGYYAVGVAPPFMAAGAILLDRWLARGRRRLRAVELHRGRGALGRARRVPDAAGPAGRHLRDHVAALARSRPRPSRSAGRSSSRRCSRWSPRCRRGSVPTRVILTNNYGEAGALELLGKGLPPVYSGHNGFWYWGPPPADRTVVVHVGDWTAADWSPYFTSCRIVAHIDNGLGIENQEQGQAISVCSGLRAPWTAIWPRLRHLS